MKMKRDRNLGERVWWGKVGNGPTQMIALYIVGCMLYSIVLLNSLVSCKFHSKYLKILTIYFKLKKINKNSNYDFPYLYFLSAISNIYSYTYTNSQGIKHSLPPTKNLIVLYFLLVFLEIFIYSL